MKFKEGDKVKIKDTKNVREYYAEKSFGMVFTISEDFAKYLKEGLSIHPWNNKYGCNYNSSDLELISNNKKTMKKRYILLKDSHSLTKGVIFEEECDGGDQGFITLNAKEHLKYKDDLKTGLKFLASRDTITKQPDWFAEVEQVWLTPDQVKKIKKLLK